MTKKSRLLRVRKKILEKSKRPRLTIFRSNKYIYAQIIDDIKGTTLVNAHSLDKKKGDKKSKIEVARQVGKTVAQKALLKKIKTIVFDRGSYKYHGRVKALAEGAREGGLIF